MKPMEGWPHARSVLHAYNYWLLFQPRYDSVIEEVHDFCDFTLAVDYHEAQAKLEADYRAGLPNVGLPPDVVQTIQWMAGTRMFTGEGLQVVPMTEEQFDQLEHWLKAQREWRKPLFYDYVPTAPDHFQYRPNFDLME